MKVRPERISGIVALSYLVLIPAGAFLMWRKLQAMDQDVVIMWDRLDMAEEPSSIGVLDMSKLRRVFQR